MREIHLWLREDGQRPKAIGAGVKPPGPGAVVAVRARSLSEALAVIRLRRELVQRLGSEPTPAVVEALSLASPEQGEILSAVREVPADSLVLRYGGSL